MLVRVSCIQSYPHKRRGFFLVKPMNHDALVQTEQPYRCAKANPKVKQENTIKLNHIICCSIVIYLTGRCIIAHPDWIQILTITHLESVLKN